MVLQKKLIDEVLFVEEVVVEQLLDKLKAGLGGISKWFADDLTGPVMAKRAGSLFWFSLRMTRRISTDFTESSNPLTGAGLLTFALQSSGLLIVILRTLSLVVMHNCGLPDSNRGPRPVLPTTHCRLQL